MEYDLDVMSYLELKASEIMDCSDYKNAYALYAQFLGALKLLAECDLFKEGELDRSDQLFSNVTEYMNTEFVFNALHSGL